MYTVCLSQCWLLNCPHLLWQCCPVSMLSNWKIVVMEAQYNSNKKQTWYGTESKQITKFSDCDYLLKTHKHWLVFHGFIPLVVMAINGFSIVHILKVLFLLTEQVWRDKWSCWIFYLKAIYCLFLIKAANGFYWFLKCAIESY